MTQKYSIPYLSYPFIIQTLQSVENERAVNLYFNMTAAYKIVFSVSPSLPF